MVTKLNLAVGIISLLLLSCKKKDLGCPKEGYEYTSSTFHCQYVPNLDSISLNDSIDLVASIPTTFADETSNAIVHNTSKIVEGPLHITMLYPNVVPAADSFRLIAKEGKVIRDSLNFSEGSLRGFRTIQWSKASNDSFQIKITIKPLKKGVYIFALGQQSAKDEDCALYKYFLRVRGDQHLYYHPEFGSGNISEYERNFGYCFKVY